MAMFTGTAGFLAQIDWAFMSGVIFGIITAYFHWKRHKREEQESLREKRRQEREEIEHRLRIKELSRMD